MRENADEIASKYRREQLKAVRAEATAEAEKEKEAERESYTEYDEPGTSSRPFGKWQTVVRKCVPFFFNKLINYKSIWIHEKIPI